MTLVRIQKGSLLPLDSYQGQMYSNLACATGVQVSIEVISNDALLFEFKKVHMFPLDLYHGQIHSDMVCAATDQGQDSCQGDSDGSLIISGNDFSSDTVKNLVFVHKH